VLRRFVELASRSLRRRTHDLLQRHGIAAETINAIAEGSPNVLDAIANAPSIS